MSSFFKNRTITLVAAFVLTATSLVGLSATSSGTVAQANGELENPPFTTIAVGDSHACGITPSDYESPNAIYCWGTNDAGQLGVVAGGSSVIEGPLDDSEWDSISLGSRHSCAIKSDGSMWCWGANDFGQLGSTGDDTEVPREVSGDIVWSLVSAGDNNTCGIDEDDAIYCWGDNSSNQLASAGGDSDIPLLVDDDLSWRKIEVSGTHACAIDSSRQLWCWGDNASYQLGIDAASTIAPALAFESNGTYGNYDWWDVQVAQDVTCALRYFNQGVYCWGLNTAWRGDASDDVVAEDLPTRVVDGFNYTSRKNVFDLSGDHQCAARYGGLYCWGNDVDGQVSGRSREPEEHEDYYPTEIYLYSSYTQVGVGVAFSCGVKWDDSWWCWGEDANDQLGMRPILPRVATTVELTGLPDSLSIASNGVAIGVTSDPALDESNGYVGGYGGCTVSKVDDTYNVEPTGNVQDCYVFAVLYDSEELIGSSDEASIEVVQALLRSKRVYFYLINQVSGLSSPIIGARVNWQQGPFSGSAAVTTGRDGSALFPAISIGETVFTFASGNTPGYKLLPGKQMTIQVDKTSGALHYYEGVFSAPGVRLVAPEGQTGGVFAGTIPAMTCQYDNLQSVGCTGRATAFRGSAGVVRAPGWCIDGGYQTNCYQMFDVTVSYTYLGVVQTYTRTWGACLDGSWNCTDEDGTWNFEMDTFPFVEVEPAVVPIWFGETARIEARALGSGRAGLRDYDVLIRSKGRADAGTGCSTTTQTTTDANGNAFLEVCPSRTGTWVVEGGALLPSKEFTINVIRTPSSPLGLALSSTAGVAVLNWNLPEHGGASAISSYRVNYRVAGTTSWRSIRARSIIGLQAQLGALKVGLSYEFRVQAVNRDGVGPWSEVYTDTLR